MEIYIKITERCSNYTGSGALPDQLNKSFKVNDATQVILVYRLIRMHDLLVWGPSGQRFMFLLERITTIIPWVPCDILD